MWARFVAQQDLATVLRCHVAAFDALGGVPEQILYDRIRTAVLGKVDERGIVYNSKLLALAAHYGYVPKACWPYRAETKGKVERPFRYVREDFFLGRSFRSLDALNAQFTQWLEQVANRRLHGTTGRIVIEHFAEERPSLEPLPAGPFNAVLRLQRRISHERMISVRATSTPSRTAPADAPAARSPNTRKQIRNMQPKAAYLQEVPANSVSFCGKNYILQSSVRGWFVA